MRKYRQPSLGGLIWAKLRICNFYIATLGKGNFSRRASWVANFYAAILGDLAMIYIWLRPPHLRFLRHARFRARFLWPEQRPPYHLLDEFGI